MTTHSAKHPIIASPQVLLAVQSVSLVSEDASRIAARLNASLNLEESSLSAASDSGNAEQRQQVAALQAQIKELNSHLALLRASIVSPEDIDSQFTDVQAHEFSKSLSESFKGVDLQTLRTVYGRSYFRPYPKNLRVLIATALVNHFTTSNASPAPIWHTLLANSGALA